VISSDMNIPNTVEPEYSNKDAEESDTVVPEVY
jgi:hypothetical protein